MLQRDDDKDAALVAQLPVVLAKRKVDAVIRQGLEARPVAGDALATGWLRLRHRVSSRARYLAVASGIRPLEPPGV
jgi:hypothetical protein